MNVVLPNIFNSECISAEWPLSFEKNIFEILHSAYMLLSYYAFSLHRNPIGCAPDSRAEGPGSWLMRATVIFILFL